MNFFKLFYRTLLFSLFFVVSLSAATVDVVLFFDKTAVEYANSNHGGSLDMYATKIIEEANFYYRSSGVNIDLNCVDAIAYDYTCVKSDTDLNHFTDDDKVRNIRAELFADYAVLITNQTNYDVGGIRLACFRT